MIVANNEGSAPIVGVYIYTFINWVWFYFVDVLQLANVLWTEPRFRKYRSLDWISKRRTGFVKHGLIKRGFIKHELVKHGSMDKTCFINRCLTNPCFINPFFFLFNQCFINPCCTSPCVRSISSWYGMLVASSVYRALRYINIFYRAVWVKFFCLPFAICANKDMNLKQYYTAGIILTM